MGEILKLLAKITEGILQGVRKGLCFLWRGFAGYCGRHKYRPRRVVCVLLAAVLLCAGTALASEWISRRRALTSGLGLANIGELATQSYRYRAVDTIEKSQELWGWKVPLTQAQSIFSYEGIIRAGYDFEKIHVDVDYGDKRITVTLPEAYIINNDILPDSLLVYSEDTNIFTPIRITDFNDTQAGMKQQGQEDAVNAGILEAARANAEVLIRGFLSGAFDLNEYELIFK